VTIAAIYARVSTEKQEKDETIASQLDALQRAAAEGGYDVAPEHIFVDGHHSGARLDRPALDRLRDLAAEGTFEAVLVARPDRLARQYAYQVLLIEELTRAGCRVVFLNHAFDETPEQQMLLQIQGVFAEYERYADIGIALVMPSARLCRSEGETWGRMGFIGRHNRSPLARHRPSRKASMLSEGL
jgi:site-specific DNA recombinase